MRATRTGLFTLAAAAAVGLTLCVAGPSFAKGGGGGSGGGGGGGANTKPAPAAKKTVLDGIEGDTSLSKFTAAIKAVGMDATLKGAGPFTVLAPNDAAFGKIDAKWQELSKPENKAKLKTLLEGHILSGKKKAADLAKETKLTAGGVTHEVKVGDDKKAVIDGAKIVKEDVEESNGYVQIVDSVLMPAEKPADKPPAGK
jgi:uncharacterized surface protein with fasciclin (FAS1) repeats